MRIAQNKLTCFSAILSLDLLPSFGISLLFMAGWKRFIGFKEDMRTSTQEGT